MPMGHNIHPFEGNDWLADVEDDPDDLGDWESQPEPILCAWDRPRPEGDPQ